MKKLTVYIILFLVTSLIITPIEPSFALQIINNNQENNANLPFIENNGQIDKQVKFYLNTLAGNVFVTKGGITYLASDISGANIVIKEKFLTIQNLQPQGIEKSDTSVNYFVGDAKNWRSNLSTYDGVDLGKLWQSIDVKLETDGNNVEKIFTVSPGGKVKNIQLSFDGIQNLSIDKDGNLVIHTEIGNLFMTKPIAYQEINGVRNYVDVSYDIKNKTYGFSVPNYNHKYNLIIDPLLASTFIGGTSLDVAKAIAVNGTGSVYITGHTSSVNYPNFTGWDRSYNYGNGDAFVSKFNNQLTSLLNTTFVGGSGLDNATSIAIDSSGNVFITGFTTSSNYPYVSGSFDSSFNGVRDTFVSKFNDGLSSLLSSTYIGGTSSDESYGIALDSSDNVFITGRTASNNFNVTTGSNDTSYNLGSYDAFVSKFNNTLSLSSSTYLGAPSTDEGRAIAINSTGYVYATGYTNSNLFPTSPSASDKVPSNGEAFVSVFDPSLTYRTVSTFLGGTGNDEANAIAINGSGYVYVAGTTTGSFPTNTTAADQVFGGQSDVFVSKLDRNLTHLVNSTYLGGSSFENATSLAIDDFGNIFVTGRTNSNPFNTTSGAADRIFGGTYDVFVSRYDPKLRFLNASTYLGAGNLDAGQAIAIDGQGNVFVTGRTASSLFNTTAGAYDTLYAGSPGDAFASKFNNALSSKSPSCTLTIQTNDSDGTMNPGQLANFTAITNATNPQYLWAIEGPILKNYTETTQFTWSTVPMDLADYTNQSVIFYWKPQSDIARKVSVSVNDGLCTNSTTTNVLIDTSDINKQAEDYYVEKNHLINSTYSRILQEHFLWHNNTNRLGPNYDGSLFFDFHNEFLKRFNSWRAEFGYTSPIPTWDPSTPILNNTADVIHINRNPSYTSINLCPWFTVTGNSSEPRDFSEPHLTGCESINILQCESNTFPPSGKSNQTHLVNFTSTWTGLNDTDSRKFFGCVFTAPYHGGRHGAVGGDMVLNQLAPKDPLFWRWHQYVNDTAETYDNLSHDNGPIVSLQVPFRLFHYITELPTVEIQSDDGQSTVNVPAITVGFTEGVTGVSAGDLTVNGSPATSVTGEEAGPYVFTGFQTPEIGLVTVNLASGNIRDHPHHSDIRNLFEGFSWTYTIVDPSLDFDEDGVNDGQEANVYRTNPTKIDTDGDGMSDGYEISTGCLIPIRDDTMSDRMDMMDMDMTMHDMMDMEDMTLPDSDGDGMSDIDEFNSGTNPCGS